MMVGIDIRSFRERLHYWLAALLLLTAAGALAQEFNPDDILIGEICDESVRISWKGVRWASSYDIVNVEDGYRVLCQSSDSSCELDELKPGHEYTLSVDAHRLGDSPVYGQRSFKLKVKDADSCPISSPRKTATPAPYG